METLIIMVVTRTQCPANGRIVPDCPPLGPTIAIFAQQQHPEFDVIQGLPYQYANLTSFTTLSSDYDSYKINNNCNISTLNLEIYNSTTHLCILFINY
jgi:hypothetical protein